MSDRNLSFALWITKANTLVKLLRHSSKLGSIWLKIRLFLVIQIAQVVRTNFLKSWLIHGISHPIWVSWLGQERRPNKWRNGNSREGWVFWFLNFKAGNASPQLTAGKLLDWIWHQRSVSFFYTKMRLMPHAVSYTQISTRTIFVFRIRSITPKFIIEIAMRTICQTTLHRGLALQTLNHGVDSHITLRLPRLSYPYPGKHEIKITD